jgi:hypothetical protein
MKLIFIEASIVPAPTAFSISNSGQDFLCSWTNPFSIDSVQIEKLNTDGSYEQVYLGLGTSHTIINTFFDVGYVIRIRSKRGNRYSDWVNRFKTNNTFKSRANVLTAVNDSHLIASEYVLRETGNLDDPEIFIGSTIRTDQYVLVDDSGITFDNSSSATNIALLAFLNGLNFSDVNAYEIYVSNTNTNMKMLIAEYYHDGSPALRDDIRIYSNFNSNSDPVLASLSKISRDNLNLTSSAFNNTKSLLFHYSGTNVYQFHIPSYRFISTTFSKHDAWEVFSSFPALSISNGDLQMMRFEANASSKRVSTISNIVLTNKRIRLSFKIVVADAVGESFSLQLYYQDGGSITTIGLIIENLTINKEYILDSSVIASLNNKLMIEYNAPSSAAINHQVQITSLTLID